MPFVYRVVGYLWLNLLVASEIVTETQLQVDICHWPLPIMGADEVSGEVVVVKSLSYILLLMVPE